VAHSTPAKVLLTTTLQPLVIQLSGSLAHGAKLLDQFLRQEPTPQKTVAFEQALRPLLQEVGRRIMAWVLNHIEPACPEEMPARLWWKGQAYRRRRAHRTAIATLFGPVVVWRRLYEPLTPGRHAIHPLELRLGIEGGVATPALAARIGGWAAEHTQRQVLALLQHDHGVPWSCTTLRKLLGCLRTGMEAHRQAAQVAQVVRWLHQARASRGRFQPVLAVGRDGVNVPLRHGAWKEGAAATVSVLDRRGKRRGTVYLGQMPEAGQHTLTTHLTALIRAILQHVDAQNLRLVYVSDDGYHPSDYYHTVLKTMPDPQRPWRPLVWLRIIDYYHACLYIQQLAEALFGPTPRGRAWAQQMRQHLKTQSDGITRVLQSAGAFRRQHGLWGKASKDVLLVDADEQESATIFTAIRKRDQSGRPQYTSIILRESNLRSELDRMRSKYDDVIVDTGGRDTRAQRASLSLADMLLLPFNPRSLDIWTLENVEKLLEAV
jgi:hypothetical protein